MARMVVRVTSAVLWLLLLACVFVAEAKVSHQQTLLRAQQQQQGPIGDPSLIHAWTEAARSWFVAAVATAVAGGVSRELEDVAVAFGLPSGEVAREVSRLPRNVIRVYAAVAAEGETLMATLPDGVMSRSGSHHGVLLLDPFPAARFGHPVLMFFINKDVSDRRCMTLGGKKLDSGECIQVARKNRCPNLMAAERSLNNRVSRHRGHLQERCTVNFLPLVRPSAEQPNSAWTSMWSQRLVCRDDVAGFAVSCPAQREFNATRHVECDPLRLNTHRCDTSHAAVRTRCRLFQTCDHAVLLSGGWNRQLSDAQSLINILDFHAMLRRNGFHEDNIKVFFANGITPEKGQPAMLPAVMKTSLRYHIKTICESAHCADSLVLYFNSPARSDGSALLWDLDNNGEADETEVYTVRELVRDLQSCAARRVLIVADQSYSGEIVRAVHAHSLAGALTNVLVFASGSETQPSWQGDLTAHWSSVDHKRTCLHQVHEDSLRDVRRSGPTLFDTSSGEATRSTLTGAPCGVHARSVTEHELRTQYEGCQNVPTRVWLVGNNEARRRR